MVCYATLRYMEYYMLRWTLVGRVQICAMVLTDEVQFGFFLTVASVELALFGEPEPNAFVWSDMGGG